MTTVQLIKLAPTAIAFLTVVSVFVLAWVNGKKLEKWL